MENAQNGNGDVIYVDQAIQIQTDQQETELLLRYKQFTLNRIFLLLRGISTILMGAFLGVYISIKGSVDTVQISMIVLSAGMGVLGLTDFVIQVRHKIPNYRAFSTQPGEYEKVQCSLKSVQIFMIAQALAQVITYMQFPETKQFYMVVMFGTVGVLFFIIIFYGTMILLLILSWLFFGLALILYIFFALIVWLSTCGRKNLFKRCLQFTRRPRHIFFPQLKKSEIDFDKMKSEVGKLWKEFTSSKQQVDCAICISSLEPQQQVLGLPCNPTSDEPVHFYHSQCAQKWFKEHTICPLCRAEMSGKYGR